MPEQWTAIPREVPLRAPVAIDGVANVLEAYLASPLAGFHREFYTTSPHEPWRWEETCDRVDPAALIPCAAASQAAPNDLLLKPEHVQHVTRCLMSRGWHPRHIVGLVHSRYARDCDRGARWTRMDAPAPIGGHPDEFEWILKRLAPTIAVCLDTGHTTLGHHWRRFIDLAGERVKHVHASDNHGHRDDHLPPGDGSIDWSEIASGLKRIGFDGWIMLELSCPDGLSLGGQFARAIGQARRLLV